MNRTLLQALTDVIAFPALSDEETVDSDAAVTQLEGISATLKSPGEVERRDDEAFVGELGEGAEGEGRRGEADFLRGKYEQLGLDDRAAGMHR